MTRLLTTLLLVTASTALPAAAAPKVPARAPVVTSLELSPPELRLYGKGARERVYVTAILSTGERRDVTAGARWTSPNSSVRPEAGGLLAAVKDGTATVTAAYGGRQVRLPVRVTGTERERAPSFQYDVLPVISRAGCNQGACHGNGEGKGGLRLSLKGEDPEGDYAIFATHGGGRRLNRTDPGRSLLLLKATSALPHGGGKRFGTDSEEYRTLAAWIASGAEMDPPSAPRLVRLEVTPGERVLVQPAQMQRLTVRGHFSDGSVRNVADRAVFSSGDPAVQVTPDGQVTAERSGDAAVLVRYAEHMENARVTFVPARREFTWKPVPANNWIDEVNFRRLKTLRLEPSRLTTDSEFVRRAFLDLIGVLPTPAETRAFLADTRADKRSRLVDALLERGEFVDFWAMKWSDLLRLEERSLDPKGVAAYQDWIRLSLSQNKPLDQFARELLTASGSTYANPPANYYRRTRSAGELAETTAQVFMGTRLLCAKCHNHPFERWKQDDYYSLAAYFSRVDRKIENVTRRDQFDKHELVGEELISVAKDGGPDGSRDVEHPRTGRPSAPGLPAHLLTAARLPSEGGEDRRVAFAQWLTARENPLFARAMVNRIWYHLLGRGIVDPVDDMRESNPASNPELLETLARDFVTHNFDMRHTIRTIVTSRTYQLASEANTTNAEDERFFSRGIAQRLPAEVLLDAMSQVTGAPEKFDGFPAGTRAVQLWAKKQRHPFLRLFGQTARESVCDCERTGEPTLGQSFALISGTIVDAKLKRPENRIGTLISGGKTDAEIVSELYLAALTREPSPAELASATKHIASRPDRRAALEDLGWALLNSKEFLLRR